MSFLAQNKTKTVLMEELKLIPDNYSVHVKINKKKFKNGDTGPLVSAIKDVVYAMKVQNIGHYPLEFDAHNAHVFIRRHLSPHGERIKVTFGH